MEQLEERLFKKVETGSEDDTHDAPEGERADARAGTYTESAITPRHAKAHQK